MTVLLAHVPNRSAEAAFAAALRQASLREVPLVVINATDMESHEDSRRARREAVRTMILRGRDLGVEVEVEQPVGPDVATMILNRAAGLPAEVIVLGIRRRSTVGKLLLGSTAQRVLMEAPCEVLLVKPAG